ANFLTDFKYDADILKSLELFGQYQQMETLLKGNK
ncbi:MAG: hypothetical protein RLZZ318_15, partial [Bacteroidota bacterium]